MRSYVITVMVLSPNKRLAVTIHGPGMPRAGSTHVFESRDEAEAFVDALNFAYMSGFRDAVATQSTGGTRESADAARASGNH